MRRESVTERGRETETVRVWLVERTFSDDEQNIVILRYATPDGGRILRKERALTSFTGDARETLAAVDAEKHNLNTVDDPESRDRYAAEVERIRESHAPDDPV